MVLPPYRYVPGLQPHPLKHAGGHRCAGNPLVEPWADGADLSQDPAWLGGLDLYNNAYWWEAHELWEERWVSIPQGVPARDLLQGCIQLAASVLRLHMGDRLSAQRLATRATTRLSRVHRAEPGLGGLELSGVVKALEEHMRSGPVPMLGPP